MTIPPKKTKGLGRGLDVLLGPAPGARDPSPTAPGVQRPASETLQWVSLDSLQTGRYQPRTRMDEEALQELAGSIARQGLLQPIVVRRIDGERFEIIAGERRFRAARLAGLGQVPVIEREVSDENALAIALIENIQREDLNPLEEATAIQRLLDEFNYTHEQASQAIGRSRSATSNLLRLLQLAEPVQTMLLAGDLEMGHARALLPLEKARQIMAAQEVVQKRLSVRETERLVQLIQTGQDPLERPAAPPKAPPAITRDIERLRERLADTLHTRVDIHAKGNGPGRLVLHFNDPEGFADLLARLQLQGVILDE